MSIETLERLTVLPGTPVPLGASQRSGGVNFAVVSNSASRMWLVLLDSRTGDPVGELAFPEEYRVGDVFTMMVAGLDPERVDYGFRVQRPGEAPGPVLLDPYAPLLAGGATWGRRRRYRSRLRAAEFDWTGDRPPGLAAADLVIYELNVRGATRHESAGTKAPGTYAGLVEKIPYLRDLGVNCVELMPVAEFDETDNPRTDPDTGEPLLNTWGYQPVGLFAPKAAYASGERPDVELKYLVRELHRAGIEVVLDVVVNHTAEGDHRGPTMSLRGLDKETYYLLTPDGSYLNFSGAGNTLNCNHPVVRQLILDCLRHWVVEYHVDGFRFDLASILARGTDGAPLANPPLLEALAHDPVLSRVKLIAEAWDAAGMYQVGTFPSYGRWMEWNGRYRDAVRAFLTGQGNSAGEFATRLVGSPDLYAGRGTVASVNFVTCHDGFTLADWTSYATKHNEANGEQGQDGIDGNLSANGGVEGPTDDPWVLAYRRRQVRNALLVLLVSHGVPMLLAGDEFGRTQLGNNNAYPHDGPMTWLDWTLAERNADLVAFVRTCIALRAAHPVLRRACHPTGDQVAGGSYPPVSWHGEEPWQPDWSPESRLVAVLLHQENPTDSVYLCVNSGSEHRKITVPDPPAGTYWRLAIDTGNDQPSGRLTGHTMYLAANSAALLVSEGESR